MKKRIVRNIFLLLSFFTTSLYSVFCQTKIDIRVKQTQTQKATLILHKVEKEVVIDSTNKTSSDHFIFILKTNHEKGLYKLKIGKNISLDFIVGTEPKISLETIIFAAEDSLKSILSEENRIYLQYKKFKRKESQLSWLLNSARGYYSDSSKFGKNIEMELYDLKKEFNQSALNLANTNQGLLVSKLILLELRPTVPNNLNTIDQRNFSIKNWWNYCDLTDSSLLNFTELNKKLWNYFDLIFNENLDKEEQDTAFINAVKVVLTHKAYPNILDNFRNSLYKEFNETDYKRIADFISNLRIEGLPPMVSEDIENNKTQYKLGQKIPDFKIAGEKGKIKISQIKSKYKLIVFWSIWCPHCIEMLPELKRIYSNYHNKGFEILAITVDDEIENCNSIVQEKRLDWFNDNINKHHLKNIKAKISFDETPKFYLVDQNQCIISLPSNVKQVEAKLKKLLK